MKKLLFIVAMALLIVSCSTKEDKAKKLIRDYMKENLKDPSSYESISFSKLDSVFTTYIGTDEGRKLYDLGGEHGTYKRKSFDLRMEAISADSRSKSKMLEDSAKYYEQKSKELEELFNKNNEKYKQEFAGWTMTHKYRAKNGFGALDFGEQQLYFDKEVTKIIPPCGAKKNK